MLRFLFCLSLASLFLFTSCNKDEENQTPEEQQQAEESFFALKVGNSWTYNYYRRVVNPDGLELLDVEEIVKVTEEMIVNNETYYTIQKTTSGDGSCGVCEENGVSTMQVRDSVGYLINIEGDILYSSESKTDYLIAEEDWGTIFGVLLPGMEDIEVDAGTFTAINNQWYAIDPSDGSEYFGRIDWHYADGVGEIKRTFVGVIAGQFIYEKRLASFDLVE